MGETDISSEFSEAGSFQYKWLNSYTLLVTCDSNDIPHSRYLSSVGFLNDVESLYKRYSIGDNELRPMALVFGGDGGLLHNSYVDHTHGLPQNSFFDDAWLLYPGGIGVSSPMKRRDRDALCAWRWLPGSTALQAWNETCGWDSALADNSPVRECRLESILIAAWCRHQYQSFYMN